ncbi:MAG: polysaccharide lyase [Verrucomicrobiae bacterium]|nr:polysaccharide lyase [Verrucomicrobiae bacterium]
MISLPFLFALPSASQEKPALLKEVDFESGDLNAMNLQAGNEDAIAIVSSPVRSGSGAVKTVLRITDPIVHKGQRAELSDGKKEPLIEMDHDYWYGLSIFLPDGFRPPSESDAVLFQWHSQQGGPSPVLAIRVRGEQWKITSDATPDKRRKLAVISLERGKWTDWVIHVRWSSSPDGFWTIWKDKTEVVSETGIITQYPEERGPYAKFGQYHSVDKNVSENTVYFDEYRIAGPGANYESIAPRP